MVQTLTIQNLPNPKNEPKEVTTRFRDDVKREYVKWINKTKQGVRMYTDEYIFAELGFKFYKSPKTIENIVFNRV